MNELQKKLETLNEEEISSLYKTTFSSVDSKLVLEHIKSFCWVDQSTINENPILMAAREGQRNVYNIIKSWLEHGKEDKENDNDEEKYP